MSFLAQLLLITMSSFAADEATTLFLKQDLNDITTNVKKASLTIDEWVTSLNLQHYDLLCLGETHDDFHRTLYAQVLAGLDFWALAIEAEPEGVARLQKDWSETKTTQHIGVSLNPVMEVLDKKMAPVVLAGVEMTKAQDAFMQQQIIKTKKKDLSRDGFIAENLLAYIRPPAKTVALYGSTHCSMNNNGLGAVPFFNFLKRMNTANLLNVIVLRRQGAGKPHPLVSYIDVGENPKRDVVVVDGEQLPPEAYNFNWEIRTLFDNFRYVIVY
jgi:hypothetical protein